MRGRNLPETATIYRITGSVPDGAGGQVEAWGEVATVPCRIASTGYKPEEREFVAQLAARVTLALVFEVGADVREQDFVRVGPRHFEVLGVLGPYSEAAGLRAIVTETR